jgi:Flp pilus assembly protein TadD
VSGRAAPEPPSLLVPARPDSQPPESEPAPLLIPGRGTGVDSLERERHQKALEQYSLGRQFETSMASTAALYYRNALKIDPDLRDVRYRLGMIQLHNDRLDQAVELFAQEVARHPDHRDAARQLGVALARVGQTDHAIAQLERMTASDPNDGESWHALGYAYLRAQRPRDAERALRRAVALPPASAEEHRDLAGALEQLGRRDEARAE